MTIVTKSALAAAILAVMAVSAQAQQGPTRQIQVLAAPGAQVAAPVAAIDQAPVQVEGQAVQIDAPAVDAAPAPVVEVAPKGAPKLVPAPVKLVEKVAPKFVVEKPIHKASYGGGFKKHCN